MWWVGHSTDSGDSPECRLVAGGQGPAPFDECVESTELNQADGGLHVRHPVVEAGLHVLLEEETTVLMTVGRADAHPVLAQAPYPGAPRAVRGREHAALAGGDHL